jgi:thiamine-phosphate pyrophosphorylase
MTRCYITDRSQLGGVEALLASIARNAAMGVELIQIREKDLTARELLALARSAVAMRRESRILVNARLDIAIAAGAQGVHLPADSISASELRRISPEGFLIGVSCHSIDELRSAEGDGADFVVYGPVFDPLSKERVQPAVGIDGLHMACAAVKMPVYALGGITEENAAACVAAGAAGIAGITLFQKPARS